MSFFAIFFPQLGDGRCVPKLEVMISRSLRKKRERERERERERNMKEETKKSNQEKRKDEFGVLKGQLLGATFSLRQKQL